MSEETAKPDPLSSVAAYMGGIAHELGRWNDRAENQSQKFEAIMEKASAYFERLAKPPEPVSAPFIPGDLPTGMYPWEPAIHSVPPEGKEVLLLTLLEGGTQMRTIGYREANAFYSRDLRTRVSVTGWLDLPPVPPR